jgi:hypothetical protein
MKANAPRQFVRLVTKAPIGKPIRFASGNAETAMPIARARSAGDGRSAA